MTDTQEQGADVSQEVAPSDVSESTTSDWRESLPEQIRGHEGLKDIKDVGALANSYLHAQSMVGADKIAIPRKSATDEDWSNVYAKLGRPEEAKGYELQFGEGQEVNDDFLNAFKEVSHNAGFTNKQAQKLATWYQSQVTSQEEIQEAQFRSLQEESVTALKKEWGKAYDERVKTASNVLQEFGDTTLADMRLADGSLVGDSPQMVKLLANMGKYLADKTGEDSFVGEKGSGVMAPDEAQSKLRELTATDTPYWDERHPEHQWYVDEAMRLREFIVG